MSTTLARGPLTAAVRTQLLTLGKPIGDGVLPVEGNWIGQPNLPGSEFDPFAVLSELFAGESFGPIAESQGNWKLPYLIENFGVTREQCSAMSDATRSLLGALRGQVLTLGTDSYKVAYVKNDSLGAPTRIDVTDPEFWHQQDTVSIWIGRSHA